MINNAREKQKDEEKRREKRREKEKKKRKEYEEKWILSVAKNLCPEKGNTLKF